MTINVGRMPYLNSELFYLRMDSPEFDLHPLVPTAMSRAAQRGELDAGPFSLADCFRLGSPGGGFERLGGFCIASRDAARSILLFSRVPWEELDGGRIAITDETATSVRLLKVVAAQKLHIAPTYVGPNEEADALLLIGDGALRARRGVEGKPWVYDLGSVWHEWTGLPFVFALWMVRRSLPEADKERLLRALDSSLEEGLRDLPAAAERRKDLGMSADEVSEYLGGFAFRAGPAEEQAIGEFTRRLRELVPSGPDELRELQALGLET
ncbi:MAG TPA: menaquinone biosynthesis protein [Dehalococcoidia bacterium]|nr:menaquinone biosynthesis protein [Dehalococcoidia bacterium]